MKINQKLFMGLKAIIFMGIMLTLSTCAMFQDFLAPSDFVSALDSQNGIRIENATISKSLVRNTGSDKFSIECDISSKSSIKIVMVDLSTIGGYSDTYLRADAKNPKHWTIANLSIAENYTGVNYTFTITAVNNQDYSNTASVSVSVISVSNYFVSTNGDDTAGGSLSSPFATIQHAINEATNYGVKKVYVSAGTYTNQNNGHCVEIKEGVAVYGGYSADFNTRNTASYPTIIDGQNTARHVVVAENIFDTATGIDGFVITGGNATVSGDDSGAGIKLMLASVFVQNCIISNNSADNMGGGLKIVSSVNAKISNNIFVGNNSHIGGAICITACSPSINNNIISNNSANDAGGIYISSDVSLPKIYNNVIVYNSANRNGGGIYIADYASPVISNNIISYNRADNDVDEDGDGGGLYLYRSSSSVINNNTINSNSGYSGGGMYLDSSSSTMNNNNISSNNVDDYGGGGGMYLRYSSPTMSNNTISYNIANTNANGGGMFLLYSSPVMNNNSICYNTAGNAGGGMRLNDYSSPAMTNNTISMNYSGDKGGGMFINNDSSPTMYNNTIRSNIAFESGSGMYISHNGASSPICIRNLILDNWNEQAGLAHVIYFRGSSSKPVFISNIIGSTNADTNHYGMWENAAITGHTLQYNFFVTNAMGFLYRNIGVGITNSVTNGANWVNINDTNWTDAEAGSTNNYVTDRIGAMAMWSNWQ